MLAKLKALWISLDKSEEPTSAAGVSPSQQSLLAGDKEGRVQNASTGKQSAKERKEKRNSDPTANSSSEKKKQSSFLKKKSGLARKNSLPLRTAKGVPAPTAGSVRDSSERSCARGKRTSPRSSAPLPNTARCAPAVSPKTNRVQSGVIIQKRDSARSLASNRQSRDSASPRARVRTSLSPRSSGASAEAEAATSAKRPHPTGAAIREFALASSGTEEIPRVFKRPLSLAWGSTSKLALAKIAIAGCKRGAGASALAPTDKDYLGAHVIGIGAMGRVYVGEEKNTGRLVAMKRINKFKAMDRKKGKRLFIERAVNIELSGHPFVCTAEAIYHTSTDCVFVFPLFLGGNLYRYLHLSRPLSEARIRVIAAEIALALKALHASGFVHRDIKPENILIHASGHVALTDFDLCEVTPDVKSKFSVHKDSSALQNLGSNGAGGQRETLGTLEYLAPEMINGYSKASVSLDWWGFGVLLYELVHKRTPWTADLGKQRNRLHIMHNILNADVEFIPSVSPELQSLILALLSRDPRQRPCSFEDVSKFEFFRSVNWDTLAKHKGPLNNKKCPPFPEPKDVNGYHSDPVQITAMEERTAHDIFSIFMPWKHSA